MPFIEVMNLLDLSINENADGDGGMAGLFLKNTKIITKMIILMIACTIKHVNK